MNCKQLEDQVIVYLDGKAAPAERRVVEAHLGECNGCRQRVAEFRQLWGVLEELPTVMPSASFDAAVRARVAAEPRRESFWSWLAPTPRMAFAVTALVVASVWLTSFQPPRQQRQIKASASVTNGDTDFGAIKELPALEDYDVLANFDPLSELSTAPSQPVPVQRPQM